MLNPYPEHFRKHFGILEPENPEITFDLDGSTPVVHQVQQLQSHHTAPLFHSPGQEKGRSHPLRDGVRSLEIQIYPKALAGETPLLNSTYKKY